MYKGRQKTSHKTLILVQGTPEGYETSAARSFVLLRRTPRAPGISGAAGCLLNIQNVLRTKVRELSQPEPADEVLDDLGVVAQESLLANLTKSDPMGFQSEINLFVKGRS